MDEKEIRSQLISSIIKKSVKQYGEGTTCLLSSESMMSTVRKTIPTGSPELDRILARDEHGKFGMPVGRIIGVSGKEASGKTTLLIMLMKHVQEMGGVASLIETEYAFDPGYAEKLGLKLDELLISQPKYLEEALDLITLNSIMFKEAREEYEAKTGQVWDVPMFIGLDSIAGIPPKAEYEAESYENEQALGLHARRLSKFFRKVSGLISKEQICLVCTNQLKTDTGVRYGNKDTEIGGKALKFHASLRLDLRRTSFIDGSIKGGEPIGIISTAKTVKNKVMVPFKSVEVPIVFGEGICYHRSLFNALLKKKIIEKKGNTFILDYKVDGEKQQLQATFEKRFLKEFKEITKLKKVRKKLEKKLDKEST